MNREQPPDYHVDWGGGDPRGPDQANTLTIATGVSIYSNDIASLPNESWFLGVEYVKRMLKVRPDGKPGLIIDPSCVELLRQLEQLHAIEDKEGKNPREGQHKHDDHGPDAIRYLIGQYLHSGAGSSLSDIYAPGQKPTEAQTFFQRNTSIERYAKF
jgi:hypothetical protein